MTDTLTFNPPYSEYEMLLLFWAQGMFVAELILLSDFQSIFIGFGLCGAVTALDDLSHSFSLGLVLLRAEWSGWKGTRDLPGLSLMVTSPSSPMSSLGCSCPLSPSDVQRVPTLLLYSQE